MMRALLRGIRAGGYAFAQSMFDHWQVVSGDPLDPTSPAYDLVMRIRERKGLKLVMPALADFNDKL